MFGYYNINYLIYILPGLILAMYAQAKISSAYKEYSRVDSGSGMTGGQVARRILDKNGLSHIRIEQIQGQLTDHYESDKQVIRLSSEVYSGTSVSSVSIAAHEVGHALQDASGYVPLKLRRGLYPIASFGSNFAFLLIFLGFIFSNILVRLGIAFFAFAVLFELVTLPVEFNASKRAENELALGIVSGDKLSGTKSVLNAAALTYVASLLVAIGNFLRLVSISNRRR